MSQPRAANPYAEYVIHILDSRGERAAPTVKLLQEAGLNPRHFASFADLSAVLAASPPHTIIVHRSEESIDLAESLKNLRQRLPETHFIVLSAAGGLAATWREWGEWIYDCVLSPPVHPRQLIQAVERAAERDSISYRAEELEGKLKVSLEEAAAAATKILPVATAPELVALSVAKLEEDSEQFLAAVLEDVRRHALPEDPAERTVVLKPGYDFTAVWDRLHQAQKLDELVREALTVISEGSGQAPAVFLRYLPNRRCLVTHHAQRVAAESWKSLGLNLSQEPDFRVSDLRHPEKLTGLKEMAQTLAGRDEFWARPMLIRDEVFGLFVIFDSAARLPAEELARIAAMAEERGQLLDLRHHLHSIEITDPATNLFTRSSVEKRLTQELARARRLFSPVSLVLLSLDQYRDILAQCGVEEAQTALRALGKIINPRVRVNDCLGKIDADQLALVMPHTPVRGAAVKAERIRRLVEAAKFGRLLPKFPKMTLSLGVAEYPAMCRDADELYMTADSALWQVKSQTVNKVCIAAPVAGFVPDFVVSAT
jgi:diguanylate cyclase (GGDEF)-like protein